mgnify:CR=1 FL=1
MSVISGLLQQLVDSFGFIGDRLKVDIASANVSVVDPVTVSGTVSVSNFPSPQSVTVASLPLPAGASQEHTIASGPHATRLSDGAVFYKATTPADTQPVSGTFFQATQPVSGSVSVSNFPGTQPVSGTVAVSGTVLVDGSATTQPVSGTLTANAGTNLNTSALNLEVTQALIKAKTDNLDVLLSSLLQPADTLAAVTSITNIVQVADGGGSLTIDGAVSVSNFPGTQPVSGTVAVSNFPATQPISGTVTANGGINLNTSALNLEATQLLVKAKTDNLDVLLSSRLKPADTLTAVDSIVQVVHIDDNGSSLTTDTTGNVAHDAVDSGNPLKIGGQARTTNPTPVADGDRVNAMFDPQGRQVTVQGHVREMVVQQRTQITTTTETTILTAGAAGVFHDLTNLVISSVNDAVVTIRDTTAGTIIMVIDVSGKTATPIPIQVPIKQTTAATNWTAQLAAGATVNIFVQAVKNL